jgi:hypothetical protein
VEDIVCQYSQQRIGSADQIASLWRQKKGICEESLTPYLPTGGERGLRFEGDEAMMATMEWIRAEMLEPHVFMMLYVFVFVFFDEW